MRIRWTIRGVERESRDMVKEVCEISQMTAGEAVDQAIAFWYAQLPEMDAEDEDDAPDA